MSEHDSECNIKSSNNIFKAPRKPAGSPRSAGANGAAVRAGKAPAGGLHHAGAPGTPPKAPNRSPKTVGGLFKAVRPGTAPASSLSRAGSMGDSLHSAPSLATHHSLLSQQSQQDCPAPSQSASPVPPAMADELGGAPQQQPEKPAEQAVCVALHIRPMSDKEVHEGCQNPFKVSPVAPQVRQLCSYMLPGALHLQSCLAP